MVQAPSDRDISKGVSHAIALGGIALHAGIVTSIVLAPHDGPTVIEQHGLRVLLDELRIVRADRGVEVIDVSGQLRIDLVEHLMAAIGALGFERGLRIGVCGAEVPLLDGGAYRVAAALRSIATPHFEPRRRITRAETVQVGESAYEFACAEETGLHVEIEVDHPLVAAKSASWHGSASDFVERIARARTYGFLSDAAALYAASRARGANSRDVVVLCDDGTTLSDPGPEPDECARHKLLDLIGDLALAGGIPRGVIRARRPGHRATREAIRIATERGMLVGC